MEAVVKHADFGTDLPGGHLLRLEVQVRIGVALVHLGDAVEGAGGIVVVGIPVGAGRGTDLGDTAAEFPEGKDIIGLESREGLGDNPAQGHGRIEEGLTDGGAPVVTGGSVQVEHVLESEGDVAVHGVGTDPAVVHGGHGVSHLVADGIDTGDHQRIGSDLLIEILGVAVVGAEDGGDVEIADGLVRRGDEVGIQLGVGDVRGIEGTLRVIEFEVGLLEHAGVVVVETETAFDLEPVERVEIQGRLAEHTVALVAVRVHVDVEVRVDVVAGVPVVHREVAGGILLVPVLLHGLHVDLTAAPGHQGVQRVVAAVALVHQVVALGTGVVACEVEGEEAVQGHLRVELGAVAALVRIRNGTGLVTVGQGNTGRGLLAPGLQGDHVVLRDTGLEETLDVVRMGYPRSLLAVAVELDELEAGVESGTPGFVVTVLDTAPVAVDIGEAVLLGIILIGQGAAAILIPLIVQFVTVITLTVAVLQLGDVRHAVEGDGTVVGNLHAGGLLTGLGGDEDNAVTGTHTVEGRGTTLEDGDGLDVLRVDIVQTGTEVHAAVGVVTGTLGIVGHRNTVHDDQRLLVGGEGGVTTDGDAGGCTDGTAEGVDLHAGDLTREGAGDARGARRHEFFRLHFLDRVAEGFLLTGDTHGGHDDFVQGVEIVFEDDGDAVLCINLLGLHAQAGDDEGLGVSGNVQGERTIRASDGTQGRAIHDDTGTGDRRAVFCRDDLTGHPARLGHGQNCHQAQRHQKKYSFHKLVD